MIHLRGLWSGNKAERLRAIGALVLLLGILGACAHYWIDVRSAAPVMDELSAPGYLRARQREAKDLMGPMGPILLDWQDALAQPWIRSLLLVAITVVITFLFFRAAAVAEENQKAGS